MIQQPAWVVETEMLLTSDVLDDERDSPQTYLQLHSFDLLSEPANVY